MRSAYFSETILQQYAHLHGVVGLALSADGTAAIRLPDGSTLCFEEVAATRKLFAYLEMGTLPSAPPRWDYLERMASLNCLEQDTSCGVLTLDAATDRVLLQAGVEEPDLTVTRLSCLVDGLLSHHQRIAEKLELDVLPRAQTAFLEASINAAHGNLFKPAILP